MKDYEHLKNQHMIRMYANVVYNTITSMLNIYIYILTKWYDIVIT